jgi:hypothetical protein
MKIGQAFPSKYIKAADLDGKEHKLFILGVKIEDVGGPGNEEDKPVMYFNSKKKGVVLNRTNAMAVAAKYGDDTEGWVDKEIILYPDQTLFQGRMVECVRMRVPVAVADTADEVPF